MHAHSGHHNLTKMICSAVSPLNCRYQSTISCLKRYAIANDSHEASDPSFGLSHRAPHRLLVRRDVSKENVVLSSAHASKQTITTSNDFAMNGGYGPYSYAENSTYQRGYIEAAKEVLKQDIISKLDVKKTTSMQIRITDLGCSVGPNTYLAVEAMVEAVEHKFKSQSLEIEVLFSDSSANDFNTLFRCLPDDRRYFATATPGSFYGRLFPKASIHIAYSSCTLCWLSKIPKEVTDESSLAFNKGSIHYDNDGRNEVFQAYQTQFAIDMELFLHARADEMISGGLMALLVAAEPDTLSDGNTTFSTEFTLLGSCLVDMAKQGIISEDKVDSFNLPLYYTRPKELKDLIVHNGSFTIERMEILDMEKKANFKKLDGKNRALCLRSCFEGLMGQHFGSGFVDEIFDRYAKKIDASSIHLKAENHKTLILLVVLKRKRPIVAELNSTPLHC